VDPSRILLQSEELKGFVFVDRCELREGLTVNTADRVEAALLAGNRVKSPICTTG
jgi:hypothetical protein